MRPPALTRTIGAIATASAVAVVVLGACGDAGAAPRPADPARTPAGIPARFQAYSASFVSANWGVVLGGTGCNYKEKRRCAARLAVTADAGRHWATMPIPDLRLESPGPGAPENAAGTVVFANRSDGWLFGTSLWATSDAGAHWRQIRLGGPVLELVTASDVAWAVVQPPGRQQLGELFTSRVGQDNWTRVPGIRLTGVVADFGGLAAHGRTAWLAADNSLWVVAATGHWHQYPLACPKDYLLSGAGAATASQVAFFCADEEGTFHTQKLVLASADGGKTTHKAGRQAPLPGDPIGFIVPAGRPGEFLIAVITPGLDYIARSADGGRSWTQANVSRTEGGAMLSSLQLVSPEDGWLVVNQLSAQNGLLRSTDGGKSWVRVAF